MSAETESAPLRAHHDATPDGLDDARRRARLALSAEAHLGEVDDWRRALVSARDSVILLWLIWLVLLAFGSPSVASMLVAIALGHAVLCAISTARSTAMKLHYFTAELERERHEIRTSFDQEREEVRALYAAKGFTEPLLSQIVDTLAVDEDRLLKVMMEEELGLSMHHVNHPLLVGVWNFLGAVIPGLFLVLPLFWFTQLRAEIWMVAGASLILAVISAFSACSTQRRFIDVFSASVVIALVTGGTVYFLSTWLAGLKLPTSLP